MQVYKLYTEFDSAPQQWAAPSESESGIAYIVTKLDYSCTCLDFTYRQRQCKHIAAVKAAS